MIRLSADRPVTAQALPAHQRICHLSFIIRLRIPLHQNSNFGIANTLPAVWGLREYFEERLNPMFFAPQPTFASHSFNIDGRDARTEAALVSNLREGTVNRPGRPPICVHRQWWNIL